MRPSHIKKEHHVKLIYTQRKESQAYLNLWIVFNHFENVQNALFHNPPRMSAINRLCRLFTLAFSKRNYCPYCAVDLTKDNLKADSYTVKINIYQPINSHSSSNHHFLPIAPATRLATSRHTPKGGTCSTRIPLPANKKALRTGFSKSSLVAAAVGRLPGRPLW